MKSIEKINGVDSNEWKIKNDILTSAKKELEETENKVSELSFTKSELKPILDELTKQFENKQYVLSVVDSQILMIILLV